MSDRLQVERNTERKCPPDIAAMRASECPPDIAAMRASECPPEIATIRAMGALWILPQ